MSTTVALVSLLKQQKQRESEGDEIELPEEDQKLSITQEGREIIKALQSESVDEHTLLKLVNQVRMGWDCIALHCIALDWIGLDFFFPIFSDSDFQSFEFQAIV